MMQSLFIPTLIQSDKQQLVFKKHSGASTQGELNGDQEIKVWTI